MILLTILFVGIQTSHSDTLYQPDQDSSLQQTSKNIMTKDHASALHSNFDPSTSVNNTTMDINKNEEQNMDDDCFKKKQKRNKCKKIIFDTFALVTCSAFVIGVCFLFYLKMFLFGFILLFFTAGVIIFFLILYACYLEERWTI